MTLCQLDSSYAPGNGVRPWESAVKKKKKSELPHHLCFKPISQSSPSMCLTPGQIQHKPEQATAVFPETNWKRCAVGIQQTQEDKVMSNRSSNCYHPDAARNQGIVGDTCISNSKLQGKPRSPASHPSSCCSPSWARHTGSQQ